MKTLTEAQLRLLAQTNDDSLTQAFPGYGRNWLRAARRQAREKFPAAPLEEVEPLTDEQLKILLKTAQDDWPQVFQGYKRSFLRSERRRAVAKWPPERRVDVSAIAEAPKGVDPLTDEQLKLLLDTAVDDERRVFVGYPRSFLREERFRAKAKFPVELLIDLDAKKKLDDARIREVDRLYRAAVHDNEKLRRELEAAYGFPQVNPRDVTIKGVAGEREATAFALASDWHCEEEVKRDSVNGQNEFNLEVFDFRARLFFDNTLKLLHKEAQDIEIRNLVLAVLGDMFTGNIHEDLAESNLLGPMDAVALAMDTIAGGIYRLLNETHPSLQIRVPFKWGNHSRITKKQRIQTEPENSLEFLIAHAIAREFAKEKRVTVIRERSTLTYLDVHGFPVRLLHGQAINYQAGIGGITIPINKAIAAWDHGRKAHVTCMGHFHQLTFGSGFIVNGSLIGYNKFAEWIKAKPEAPQQAFFLIDAKHGLTMRAPILLEAAGGSERAAVA